MKQADDLKKEYGKKLKQFAPNVTAKDKKDAAKELGIHYNTVGNYLKGNVVDVEHGAFMIGFFGVRIRRRIEMVQKVIAA